MPTDYRLQIIADDTFLQAMRFDAAAEPELIRLEPQAVKQDATKLGLDYTVVTTTVAIIKAIVSLAEVSAKIFKWLKRSKAEKIIIQTPFHTIEFTKTEAVTPEDVHKVLEAAMKF